MHMTCKRASLRAEGLLFLYGLESYPESSLQLHRRLDSLDTAGPKRPHLGVCPGPNIPLQEKGEATHSSILAWRIPWTEKPGLENFEHSFASM